LLAGLVALVLTDALADALTDALAFVVELDLSETVAFLAAYLVELVVATFTAVTFDLTVLLEDTELFDEEFTLFIDVALAFELSVLFTVFVSFLTAAFAYVLLDSLSVNAFNERVVLFERLDLFAD